MALAVSIVCGVGAHAQAPVGGEFQVNLFTPSDQSYADIAIDGQGDFVVVWQSYGQDGSSDGIFARRFSVAGTPESPELQVNTFTFSSERIPAVASAPDGNFVVVWQNAADVFGRRFDAFGQPQSVAFLVAVYVQAPNDVAVRSDGSFIVVWTSDGDGYGGGIFARRYSSDGTPLGVEFQVNSYTANLQENASVAFSADGGFVVVWQSFGQDGSDNGVFARRFSLSAAFEGTEFQVNSYTPGAQRNPQVAIASDGDFVIAWQSFGQDGSGDGVFGRRYDSSGVAQGSELQVSVMTTGSQVRPKVAADGSGFVVVWDTSGVAAPYDVVLRRFRESGAPAGGEVTVHSLFTGAQRRSSVAMRSGGDFVVAWDSYPQDGSGSGVFARRFAASFPIDVDGDGAVQALTDGLLILRRLFGFSGNTLINGAVNLGGCTRCTAGEIEAFLDALH